MAVAEPPVKSIRKRRKYWRSRFAPSPTGQLHLGHGYSALCVWQAAGERPENFLLRIDDLDHSRCRPEFVEQIFEDLCWLGLGWQAEPIAQSARLARYAETLEALQADGLVYPCWLTRAEISEVATAPHGPVQKAPHTRGQLSADAQAEREARGIQPAWRLDMTAALARAGQLSWTEAINETGQTKIHTAAEHLVKLGDLVLGRRDLAASYHLAVVLDDADSAVELVLRGEDLRPFAPLHRLLQQLLDLPETIFAHHPLVCDESGKRLAKRDDARALARYRADGMGPQALARLMPPITVF